MQYHGIVAFVSTSTSNLKFSPLLSSDLGACQLPGQILASQSDLVIRIVNESNIVLKSVEDYSGNWQAGLRR